MAVKKEIPITTVVDWKKVIARFIFTILLMGGILFLSAGTTRWWEGWVYTVLSFALLVGGRVILLIKSPETAAERMSAGNKEDTKAWDKKIVPLVALYIPMAAWVVAGFDRRFGPSLSFPLWVQITALVLHFLFGGVGTWAMLKNRFFSSHVRIQKDRGHVVIDDGPYAWMRHPGYAFAIFSWVVLPFYFNSWWIAVPIFIMVVGYIYRTSLEDKTLQAELPGYKEYTHRVKHRLLPGVW